MKANIPFLFVGNFLQKHRGSVGISQKMTTWLQEEDGVTIPAVSEYENTFYRFFDIIITIILQRPKRIFVDTYSGKAFIITVATFCASRLTGTQVNCVLRGGKLFDFFQDYPRLLSFIFNRCRCYSPSLFLIDKFRDKEFNITYLPNPVRLDNFEFVRGESNPFSLLWVRGFVSIYNPDVPIKILASLKHRYPNCTLTMIGPDRGLLKECKKLAIELGVQDNITFVGSVPNNELYKYYQSHSVYLNTTSYESFGVAVIEAASCGIPIVSNNVGEIPYLWEDQRDILLVEDNSIEDFSRKIASLFDDDDLSSNIALAAKANVQSFDWKIVKSNWLRLINDDRIA